MPRLSLSERSRRWQLVRSAMDACCIDCVITPAGAGPTGAQSDSGYLTAAGPAGDDAICVFPLRDEVTAIVARAGPWRSLQDWVSDVREAGASCIAPTLQRLRELSLPHCRVGVVGPDTSPSSPPGTHSQGLLYQLREAFPKVEWLDFTDQMRATRMVKSEEEVELLRRGALLVDRAFERAADVARAGIRDYEVWGAAMGALLRGGSDWPVRSRWGAGPRPRLLPRPSHAVLQRGYLIVNELEASVRGYRAHGSQPLAIEDCDRILKDLYAMYAGFWEGCLDGLRVGSSIAEVAEACRAATASVAPAEGRYAGVTGTLSLRGEGIAYDAPTPPTSRNGAKKSRPRSRPGRGGSHSTPPDEQEILETVLAAGWALAYTPSLQLDIDGRVYRAAWGDTVVLHENGAERLGRRSPGLLFSRAWAAAP